MYFEEVLRKRRGDGHTRAQQQRPGVVRFIPGGFDEVAEEAQFTQHLVIEEVPRNGGARGLVFTRLEDRRPRVGGLIRRMLGL